MAKATRLELTGKDREYFEALVRTRTTPAQAVQRAKNDTVKGKRTLD